MKRKLRLTAAVALILLIAVNAILLGGRVVGRARLDLTEQGIYTLSGGTLKILRGLRQPVRLKLYYSRTAAVRGPEDIRYYNTYYLYVRDLLQEYASRSGGMLQLSIIDPRAYTEQEDEAIRAGVRRFPLSEDESFFFGLVAQTELGRQEAIPFFEPGRQELVEYDISKLLVEVTRSGKPRLGILSSLPVMGSQISPYMRQMMEIQGRDAGAPWHIVSQLREQFDVVNVPPDTESVDPQLDVLLIIHPKDLPQRTLFAIDQYVMRGGRLVVFQDPHCLSDRPGPTGPMQQMGRDTSSDLSELLRGWGVEMVSGAIAVDRSLAISASPYQGAMPQPIVTFLNLGRDEMNAEEPVTARLGALQMLFAGVIRPVDGAEVTVEPLLRTTADAGVWTPEGEFELATPDFQGIARAAQPAREPLFLGCRVTGRLQTNFPHGLPEPETEEEGQDAPQGDGEGEQAQEPEPPALVTTTDGESTLLVFADVDMLSDPVAYQQTFFGSAQVGDNASLALNAAEWVSGGSHLIAIRTRGRYSRPFEVVERIELEAEKATAERIAVLEQRIAEYEQQLRELRAPGPDSTPRLIETSALEERRRIEQEIRDARKEIRRLNAARRERIEALKARLQLHNLVWAPALVLLIAVGLGLVRYVNAQRYAAGRAL